MFFAFKFTHPQQTHYPSTQTHVYIYIYIYIYIYMNRYIYIYEQIYIYIERERSIHAHTETHTCIKKEKGKDRLDVCVQLCNTATSYTQSNTHTHIYTELLTEVCIIYKYSGAPARMYTSIHVMVSVFDPRTFSLHLYSWFWLGTSLWH